jgi:hypothetical protein
MDKKYKRPEKTFQDNLSEKEIKELLIDYVPVEDITSVSINTHIRYFLIKDGKKSFRMGGNLNKIDTDKGYIVLSNGKMNWSVQLKDTILFKKQNTDDIKQYYENKLKKYKKKIKQLENKIIEQDKTLQHIKQKIKSKK